MLDTLILGTPCLWSSSGVLLATVGGMAAYTVLVGHLKGYYSCIYPLSSHLAAVVAAIWCCISSILGLRGPKGSQMGSQMGSQLGARI